MPAGLSVRGTCAAGHVTTETAPPGRVTWSGTCATENCALPVRARRLPRTDAAPADPSTPDAPFVRLDSYAALPDHDDRSGIVVDDPAPAAADSPPAADAPTPDPVSAADDATVAGSPAAAGRPRYRGHPLHGH